MIKINISSLADLSVALLCSLEKNELKSKLLNSGSSIDLPGRPITD